MKNTLRPRTIIWVKTSFSDGDIQWVGYLEGTKKSFSNAWCAYGRVITLSEKPMRLVFFEKTTKPFIARKHMSLETAKRLANAELKKVRNTLLKTYFI